MPDSRPPTAMNDQRDKPGRYARAMAQYTTLLILLPSTTLAGYWIGSLLDGYFETGPMLTVAFIFLGAGVGFYQMYRILIEGGGKPPPGKDPEL